MSDVPSQAVVRRYLLVLGSCYLLAACGSKFSASQGSGGSSGALGNGGAPQAGNGAGGALGRSGASAGGAPPADDGGAAGDAGSPFEEAGAGGVALIGHGGSSGNAGKGGNAGSGGGIDLPLIPQSGLALWLRADAGVQQSDGLVRSWLDQSVNHWNAVQNGTNVRPEYLEQGLNKRPALKFDGVGQFLNLPDGTLGDYSQGFAGFIVLQPAAASDCASALELSNGTEIDDIALGVWQNKWTYEVESSFIQTGEVDLLAPSLYAVNHQPKIEMVDATADLRINGAVMQSLQMPLPASNVRKNAFLGHTLYGECKFFSGLIAEIIVYQRGLKPSEVRAVESYLEQHWDLVGDLTP